MQQTRTPAKRWDRIRLIYVFNLSFGLMLLGLGDSAWAAGETAAPPKVKAPLVALPTTLPPMTIKDRGKDVLVAEYIAFPNGSFTVKTSPLPDLAARITQATITCNNGVSSIEFNPHEAFQGVLDGCIAGKMPVIKLN